MARLLARPNFSELEAKDHGSEKLHLPAMLYAIDSRRSSTFESPTY